ncbi:MAG: MAPEG family protein [Gammaproteobacteria bacterium]
MTVAFWCVLAAAFLPLLFTGLAKLGGRGFDNRAPRAWLESQSGWRLRAHWAQENSYESFPPFAAGVIIAHIAGAPQGTIDALALVYVAARLVYGGFYVANLALARSLAWTAGAACVVGLFIAAA